MVAGRQGGNKRGREKKPNKRQLQAKTQAQPHPHGALESKLYLNLFLLGKRLGLL